MSRRVVVTGIGLVSSLGIGTSANWNALLAGTSGVARITKFDATGYAAQIAAEVTGFDPLQFVEKKDVKKMDVFIQYAIAAAQFAMDDSKLPVTPGQRRAGRRVHRVRHRRVHHHRARAPRAARRAGRGRSPPSSSRRRSSTWRRDRSPSGSAPRDRISATCTACSASAHAIGDAFEIIQRGDADAMIAGGSEAAITPMGVGGFAALRALSTRNDDPQHASRPFDRDRDGFIIGEGAGILILEELEHARRRGAPIYAELVGYGMSARRLSHYRPVGRRRRRRARHGDGDEQGRHRARPGRLHQRARHLDAAQRSRSRRSPSSAASATHAQYARRVLDQVDDRPSAGRAPAVSKPASRRWRCAIRSCRRPSTSSIPDAGVRSRLRAAHQPQDADPLRAVELVRLRRHQRRAPVQEIRRVTTA